MDKPSKTPWFQSKAAAWGLAALSFAFVGTWLAGKLLDWPWPDGTDWQAIWTFFTFLVAAIAASAALAQLAAHQTAQIEQSRPYVIVDFAFRSTLVLIEIKNIGQTSAKDVKLSWLPEPTAMDERKTAAIKRNLVDGHVPFLAPGRSIRYAVGLGAEYWKSDEIPKQYTVEAVYLDIHGQEFGRGEQMVLDLAQWAEALADSDYDNKNWNQFKKQAEAQKKISEHLARIDDRAEGLLASFAQTAVQMLVASRVGRGEGVVWAVIPNALEARLVANVGTEVARHVEIAEVGADGGSDFLQVDDENLPRDVRTGDAVTLSLSPSLGQPSSTQIRVSWTEGGRRHQAEYIVGLGR